VTPLPRALVAVVVSLGLLAAQNTLGQDRVVSPNAGMPYLGVNGTFTLDQQELASRDPRNPRRRSPAGLRAARKMSPSRAYTAKPTATSRRLEVDDGAGRWRDPRDRRNPRSVPRLRGAGGPAVTDTTSEQRREESKRRASALVTVMDLLGKPVDAETIQRAALVPLGSEAMQAVAAEEDQS
jgi:hypothetical protein